MTRARLAQGVEALETRMGQPSPLASTLHQALLGAVFPLSSVQVIQVARENEAPAIVLTLLSGLPRGEFLSLDALITVLEGGSPGITLETGGEPASLSEH